MIEAAWFAYLQPGALIQYLEETLPQLKGREGLRKRRLFASACCRQVWDALPDERFRIAVEAVDRAADAPELADEIDAWTAILAPLIKALGVVDLLSRYPGHPDAARHASEQVHLSELIPEVSLWNMDRRHAAEATMAALRADWGWLAWMAFGGLKQHHCAILRDLFGNPFRPVQMNPRWFTTIVQALSEQIYQERDFALMPLLGDALQDAGCACTEILDHCTEQVHVRGCWLIDLLRVDPLLDQGNGEPGLAAGTRVDRPCQAGDSG